MTQILRNRKTRKSFAKRQMRAANLQRSDYDWRMFLKINRCKLGWNRFAEIRGLELEGDDGVQSD